MELNENPRNLPCTAAQTPARAERRLPGEEGVWAFIFGDMILFGVFFVTFMIYRAENAELFAASQLTLNRTYGLINTLLLLTSSWFVARAVRAACHDMSSRAPAFLLSGIFCGTGFVILKIFEYREKLSAGISLNSNEFYIFYFMFTGIHLLHVMIGLGILGYMFLRSRSGATDHGYGTTMEGGGAFWHLVDLLWIILFTLLYLVR